MQSLHSHVERIDELLVGTVFMGGFPALNDDEQQQSPPESDNARSIDADLT